MGFTEIGIIISLDYIYQTLIAIRAKAEDVTLLGLGISGEEEAQMNPLFVGMCKHLY